MVTLESSACGFYGLKSMYADIHAWSGLAVLALPHNKGRE